MLFIVIVNFLKAKAAWEATKFTKQITKLPFNIKRTANSMVILLNKGTNIFRAFLLFVIALANTS